MYFWKVDKLVEDFKAARVSQKEEFKYMILFTVLMTLGSDQSLYINSYNVYDSINTISGSAVSVWGIYYCYKINSAGDNKDFIVRTMCLGLPVLFRVFVYFMPIFVLGGVLERLFGEGLITDESNAAVYETSVVTVVITMIFMVSYYLYLAKKIRAVSS